MNQYKRKTIKEKYEDILAAPGSIMIHNNLVVGSKTLIDELMSSQRSTDSNQPKFSQISEEEST